MTRTPAPRSAYADPAHAEHLIAEARRMRAALLLDAARGAWRVAMHGLSALLSRRPARA